MFLIFNIISLYKVDSSQLYMSWKGNWSISHEKILAQDSLSASNAKSHVNDYFAIITKKSSSDFIIEVFESPQNMDLVLYNFSIEFVQNSIKLKDGSNEYKYNPTNAFEEKLTVSGMYQKFTFHFIYVNNNRYQLSVFDLDNQEWNFFNIIKDIDRHDPTWFEENFWLIFGYVFLSLFFFILYNFAFQRFSKLADENEKRIQQEKKLPKPEFEDALTPGYAKRRTPTTSNVTD